MGSGTSAAQSEWTDAFVKRFRELGWKDGENVEINYRWAEGRSERFAEIAAEFVRLNVGVIVTHNTPPTLAAKRATSTIPIVFATAGDPVGTGIVASFARPGGNVTGLSSETPDTASKKLGLLREIIPELRRISILADVGNPYAMLDQRKIKEAAREVGIDVTTFEVREAKDIDTSFEAMKDRVQAVFVLAVRSCLPIAFESILWRSRNGCPACTACESTLRLEV
jgi:putative tryptophan/tyrosine transport system substrate-binding protein